MDNLFLLGESGPFVVFMRRGWTICFYYGRVDHLFLLGESSPFVVFVMGGWTIYCFY